MPGTSAHRAFNLFLVKIITAVAGVLVAVELVQLLPLGGVLISIAVLAMGLFTFVLALHWWKGVGARNFEELRRGYTTLVLHYGSFAPIAHRGWHQTRWRLPWDYSGCWVLSPQGQVLQPPHEGVDAPGFYPSPHKAGAFELWTGTAWSGHYRT
ncbi:hypothetical protein [Kineococcus xinjiangensis]|nr:hypothetical protein [Kineococcus xinjiangensis]